MPEPVPDLETVSAFAPGGVVVNVAVTARSALIVRSQLPVPEQAPLQPVKVEPGSGVALRLTELPDV